MAAPRFVPVTTCSAAHHSRAFVCLLWVLAVLCAGCGVAHDMATPAQPVRAIEARAERIDVAGGVTLPLRRYPAAAPRKAVLLALHGFNDYSRFIGESARYFARHGIETVAYDQRGFGAASDRGEWSGVEAMAGDFLAVLAGVRREHPGVPVYALGESMGASVIAVALARVPQTQLDGAILSTPAVWSRDTMPWYQRLGIWLGARLAPGFTLSSTRFNIAPSDNPAVRAAVVNDPLVIGETRLDHLDALTDLMEAGQRALPRIEHRALLLYGLRDVMMPRAPMIALFERWPVDGGGHFRFALYPAGYHVLMRDRQRQVVWDDVLSWMLKPDAGLPSGFERRRAQVLPLLREQP